MTDFSLDSPDYKLKFALETRFAHARVEGYNEALQLMRMIAGWLTRQPQSKFAKEVQSWLKAAHQAQQERLMNDEKYRPASHEFQQLDEGGFEQA